MRKSGWLLIMLMAVFVSACSDGAEETVTSAPAERLMVINSDSPGMEIDIKPYIVPGKTTIFDFFSEFCGPCVMMSGMLEELVELRDDIVVRKIDINRPGLDRIDFGSPVAQQYQLHAIPHLIVYDPSGGETVPERAISYISDIVYSDLARVNEHANTMDEVYDAVRVGIVPPPLTTVDSPAAFALVVHNASGDTLHVPVTENFNTRLRFLGIVQLWVERLGADTEIAAIPPQAARAGNRYAMGGTIIRGGSLRTLPADYQDTWPVAIPTTGWEPGDYQFIIEYRRANPAGVVASDTGSFTIVK